MIARLSAPIRHLLLLLLAAGLTFAAEQLPSLDLNAQASSLLTLAIAALLAWLTPLIQSYGLGQLGAEATDLDDFVTATDNSSRPDDGPQDVSQDPNVTLVSDEGAEDN
jgi:hypothetical protein